MQKEDKALTPVDVGNLVFEEETPKPVLVDDLVFEEESAPAPVMEGGIDHTLPVGFGQGEETKPLTPKQKIEANDKAFGKAVAKTVHNITAPVVEGAEKLLNKIPGVNVDFSSTYDPEKAKEAEKQSDLSYETYDLVGKLAHTDINLADATPDDAKNYNNALYHVVVDKLGNKDLGFDSKKGEYVVVTKNGDKVPLNQSTMKSILADGLGDKYELSGAMAGAKLGLDVSKPLKNPYLKGAGVAIGSAIGAGAGSLVDTFSNAIETGQKLSAAQYGNEANKAIALDLAGSAVAPLVIKGVVAGAKGTHKATKSMIQMLDKAKQFDVNGYAQKRIIDDMAKLPEVEQGRYLDALDFAKENNIKLTSTSVIDHPQIDQLVQVLARNPFIRQGVKNLESKSRDKLIAKVFDVLESAGPKATAEELDPLLKQELGDALLERNAQVRAAYDDFEHKVSGQVVTKAKGLMDDVSVVGDKYGFRDESGALLDDDIVSAEKYVKKIFDPRVQNHTLDAKVLDKISSNFGKRASAFKTTNPKLHAYYSEVKGLVDKEIQKVSAYEGDDVAKALNVARKAYKEKVGIYGNKSEFSEIRKAMESDRPNEAINALLSGEKGLDNANMLKQELGGTEAGDALLGALGRKHMDDVLEQVDMKSPSAIGRMLSSDKMKVAKRLLGEKRSADLDNIATLMEMMGRTEKLLAGAGSEMATATAEKPLDKVFKGIKKMMYRQQFKRLFGKVFDNTLAQDMLHKTLAAAEKAKTPKEIRRVDSYLKQTAKTLERVTGEDFSDIYDKRKIRQAEIVEKKAQQAEEEAIAKEVDAFEMPDTAELLAVGKTANNDDVVLLNQSIGRLQKGEYTDADVERYVKARKSLDDETFSKAYEKEKVQSFPAKYRKEDLPVELEKMGKLRDYLLSNPQLKYGNEFNPNSVKALMNDLRKEGVPRSTEHDKLYDDMKEMYTALKANIDEAYPKQSASVEHVLEEPLDANGNALFAKGGDNLLAGAVSGVQEDENGNITLDPEKFLMGLGGYTVAKALVKSPRVKEELKELVRSALDDLDEAMNKSAGGGKPSNKAKRAVKQDPFAPAESSKDGTAVFERGETWIRDGQVRGYGFEKVWKKDVVAKEDLTTTDVLSNPRLMAHADEYEKRGKVVFDFPDREAPVFRIVFNKGEGKVSKYEQNVDGKLVAVEKEANDVHAFASPIKIGKNIDIVKQDVMDALEKHRGTYEDIPYSKESWDALFPDNRVQTPLGEVKLGEKQFDKLDPNIPNPKNLSQKKQDRRHHLSYIVQTLKEPAFVVEKDNGQRMFFKEIIDSKGLRQYASVTFRDGDMHIGISSHPRDYKQILKDVKKGDVIYMSEAEHTVGSAASSHPSPTIADSEIVAQKPNDVKKDAK